MPDLRGIVDFPEAGEGTSLRFRASDLYDLQKLFGDDWFSNANVRMDRFDLVFIEACLKHGCKKDGKPAKVTLDMATENVALDVVALKLLDALYMGVFGETFGDHLRKLADRLQEIENADRPPIRPVNSSPALDGSLTGRESDLTNSGNSVL